MIREPLLAVILAILRCTWSVALTRIPALSSRAPLSALQKHSSSQRPRPLANLPLKFPN